MNNNSQPSPKPQPLRRVASYSTNAAARDCPNILVTVKYKWDTQKNTFYGNLNDLYSTVEIHLDPAGWKLGVYKALDYSLVIDHTGLGNTAYLEFEEIVQVTIGDLKASAKYKDSGVEFSGPTRVLNILVKGKLDGDKNHLDAWCFLMKSGNSY